MGSERQYKVLSAIGRGGCGVVYRAEMVGPGGFTKVVALKALHPDVSASSEVARRLRDEGRMLGMVHHPSIVAADGLVLLRGRWTIVMEYVEGLTLRSIFRNGPLPVRVGLAIGQLIAEALDHAFRVRGPEGQPLRLIHRDIKPSNVKVTHLGEVKVLDFGLARADFDQREADSARQQFMSVPYMAPERLEGGGTSRCDVYSLGTVLYESLTGEGFGRAFGNPARHAEAVSTSRARMEQQGLDRTIVELVESMLSHDPEHRPTMGEAERRLRALVDDTAGPSLRDWAREHIPPDAGQREFGADVEDTLVGKVLREAPSNRVTGQWSLVETRTPAREATVPPALVHEDAPRPPGRGAMGAAIVIGFAVGSMIAAALLIAGWVLLRG